tara:strand:+ start:26 stop:145 length:120 start_codon:yes stop_codon:yes gene_type:complete
MELRVKVMLVGMEETVAPAVMMEQVVAVEPLVLVVRELE